MGKRVWEKVNCLSYNSPDGGCGERGWEGVCDGVYSRVT